MKYHSVAIQVRRAARRSLVRGALRTYVATVCCMGLAGSLVVTLPAMAAVPSGEQVARDSDCFSCHAVDHGGVGPAFAAVAKRFAHQPGAKAKLIHAVKHGHVGTWGQVPMPPHPNLSPSQLDEVVSWVLSLNRAALTGGSASGKTYTYAVNGKSVTLDFPVYRPGTKKVTKTVFRGYELFNSYCYRCHGQDAVGMETAPDLRRAVLNGMSVAQMTQIAMEGVKDKGMPAWAGFFSPADINAIYQYVAGRAYHLVGEGIPPR